MKFNLINNFILVLSILFLNSCGVDEPDNFDADFIPDSEEEATPQAGSNGVTGNKYTTGTAEGHEWADLGLSVKWSTENFSDGTSNHQVFAWGESTTKKTYTKANYSIDEFEDPVTETWGGKWRMPTWIELQELFVHCTRKYTSYNGTYGLELTAPNGGTIFLPFVGYMKESSKNSSNSIYWSKSTTPSSPRVITWNKDQVQKEQPYMTTVYKYYGCAIRPVYDDGSWKPSSSANATIRVIKTTPTSVWLKANGSNSVAFYKVGNVYYNSNATIIIDNLVPNTSYQKKIYFYDYAEQSSTTNEVEFQTPEADYSYMCVDGKMKLLNTVTAFIEYAPAGTVKGTNFKILQFRLDKENWFNIEYSVPHYEPLDNVWSDGTYKIDNGGYWHYAAYGGINGKTFSCYKEGFLKIKTLGTKLTQYDYQDKSSRINSSCIVHFVGQDSK